MFGGRFARRPKLVSWHIDAPQAGVPVERPHLEVRGWLSFDRPFPDERLEVVLAHPGGVVAIPLQHRPDVASAFPTLHCRGFYRLVDLAQTGLDRLALRIHHPGGLHDEPFEIGADPSIGARSSYFRLNPDEHSEPVGSVLSGEQLAGWRRDGFLLLPGFYDDHEIAQMNAYIDGLWQQRAELDWQVTIDEYIGTGRKKRTLFRDVAAEARSEPYKLNDLYLASGPVRDLVLDSRVAAILSPLLYGGDPMICSSLYFEYGSQQEPHFDTFFMAPLVRDRMLATWIALEDVTEDNGPLRYYPGSHRIEPYRFTDGRFALDPAQKKECYDYVDAELARRGIGPRRLLARRGDLFVWHAQLLHGGEPIRDPAATRRSLVTHYFCRQDHDPSACRAFGAGLYYLDRDYLQPGSFDAAAHRYA